MGKIFSSSRSDAYGVTEMVAELDGTVRSGEP